MNLEALQHIVRAAGALAEDREFLVMGSASLLVSFPELGEGGMPLAATYDADICPQPFDEITGTMLDEALGENRAYYRRHGYHADILRDSIFDTLPRAWRDRLIPVPECPGSFALEPHDLAAVKLLVGRPKDLSLVENLASRKLLDPETVRSRIECLDIPLEQRPRLQANYRNIFH